MARTSSKKKADTVELKRTTFKTAVNVVQDGKLVFGTTATRSYGAGPIDALGDLIAKVITDNPTVPKTARLDKTRADQFGVVFISEDGATEWHASVVFAHNQCAMCGATPQKAHDWCSGCKGGGTQDVDFGSLAEELFGDME